MDQEALKEEYFQYLKVSTVNYYDHECLLRYLFSREFYSPVRLDEDRVAWGLLLRNGFLLKNDIPLGFLDFIGTCTILELLLGLAQQYDEYVMQRYSGDVNRSHLWFWMMVDNLGLYSAEYKDQMWNDRSKENCRRILDIFLDRQYDQNCHGGLFPLETVTVDMREIPLWGQINHYFREKKLWNLYREE